MRKNVLDYVQRIMSDMDADPVNSIGDTDESLQIAEIVRDVYYNLLDEFDIKAKNTLFQLYGSSDTKSPTHMGIPSEIYHVEKIQYDVRTNEAKDTEPRYRTIKYLEPEEFLAWVMRRSSREDNVTEVEDMSGKEVGGAGIKLFIRNDKQPEYWTSFDDKWVVFDSWRKDVETTMQSHKIIAFGPQRHTFYLENTFVPEIPAQLEQLLLAEAKSYAFSVFLQEQNPALEVSRNRLRRRAQLNMNKQKGQRVKFPNYGRK